MSNNPRRGFSLYFLLILIVAAMLLIPSLLSGKQATYTRNDLEADISAGNIVQASVTPGKVPPAGEVNIQTKSGARHILYVTNASEIEQYLMDKDINVAVTKADEDSWFMTTILPLII